MKNLVCARQTGGEEINSQLKDSVAALKWICSLGVMETQVQHRTSSDRGPGKDVWRSDCSQIGGWGVVGAPWGMEEWMLEAEEKAHNIGFESQ